MVIIEWVTNRKWRCCIGKGCCSVPFITISGGFPDAMRCVPTGQADPAPTVGSVIRANTSFAPTRFGLLGRTMARPYDIVLCVFGGRVGSD